jgi:hypothetical protein
MLCCLFSVALFWFLGVTGFGTDKELSAKSPLNQLLVSIPFKNAFRGAEAGAVKR